MMILGIEAAIGGGSLSLQTDGREISAWTGNDDGLRAEHLISRIDDLLASVGVATGKLGTIAVSVGPGSFTGIRIAMATAMGMKAALDIHLSSLSALEAIAYAYQHTGIVAVPIGRGGAAAQRFEKGSPIEPPYGVSVNDLFESRSGSDLLLHPELASESDDSVSRCDRNIATAIALMASAGIAANAEPIFLSKSN